MGKHFTAKRFIEAIPGTGGIISAIARKVGCSWSTAQKYIKTYPTIKKVYEAERESILDVAESTIYRNVQLAYKKQTDESKPVDVADAKWLLSRRGKDRGYAERQEIQHSGPEGGKLIVEITGNIKADEL